jgi:hypothetical protein
MYTQNPQKIIPKQAIQDPSKRIIFQDHAIFLPFLLQIPQKSCTFAA